MRRWVTDDAGRRWGVERVGRTSGLVPTKPGKGHLPEPADILRFSCESDQSEPSREVSTRAGVFERLTDGELKALLDTAPQGP